MMRFQEKGTPDIRAPVFVEGLPGIGNVGKLAADHLVDVLDATAWCDIQGPDLPPQVTVQEDGTVRLVQCRLWTVPAKGKAPALVVLTGDAQPLTGEGQYALVEGVLDRLDGLGCTRMFTLGGYGIGSSVDEPCVLGAATDTDMVTRLKKAGVRFPEDEPGGGIVGASGLFLGLGMQHGISGGCLMGETSGYMVDPKAARAVLRVLATLLQRDLKLEDLEEKAEELDRITRQLHEVTRQDSGDLHYIG